MSKTTFIYALCEPGTRTVRYIGKTAHLKKRFKSHLNWSSRAKTHLGNWLRKIISQGRPPELVVLREVPGDGAEAEKRFIRLARGCKIDLVNGTEGGEGLTPTPDTRKKLSVWQKGKPKPPLSVEHRANISAGLIGLKRTPAQCKAIGDRQRGEKRFSHSREHNLSIGVSLQGVKHASSSSRFLGVSWDKKNKKWKARIQVNGSGIWRGRFLLELDAALEYDKAAIEFFGPKAKLNFPA